MKKWFIFISLKPNKNKDVFSLSGGTGESEPMLSPVVRKHLRRTRLELLHKEYEVSNTALMRLQQWT